MNQSLTLCLAALIPGVTASAQDWAKARLEKSPRHLEWVKVKHDQREVNCFVDYPEVKDKATAVILIHEIFGLTDWVRDVADRLADLAQWLKQLIHGRALAKTQAEHHQNPFVRRQHAKLMTHLESQIEAVKKQIEALLEQDAALQQRVTCLDKI